MREGNLPVRWAPQSGGDGSKIEAARTQAAISPFGSGTVDVYGWDGTAWTDAGIDIEVQHYFGVEVPSGARVLVGKVRGAWIIVQAEC